jgi:hypothetical protein
MSLLGGDKWSTSRPSRFTLEKVYQYPLNRRLGGPLEVVCIRKKSLAPHQNLNHGSSRSWPSHYTDYTISAPSTSLCCCMSHLWHQSTTTHMRCMYIEDWFKPILPFLLHKFKLLIPTADSPPPLPSVNTQVTPMAFNIILPLWVVSLIKIFVAHFSFV